MNIIMIWTCISICVWLCMYLCVCVCVSVYARYESHVSRHSLVCTYMFSPSRSTVVSDEEEAMAAATAAAPSSPAAVFQSISHCENFTLPLLWCTRPCMTGCSVLKMSWSVTMVESCSTRSSCAAVHATAAVLFAALAAAAAALAVVCA